MTVARSHSIVRTIPWLIVLCLLTVPVRAQYGGGTGEPNDPYLIYTAEQLNAIGADVNDWDKHFQLAADVNLAEYTGEQFHMIGTMRDKFVGTFDGAGHTIANFTYATGDASFIGLFSQVGDGAQIKDVTLDSAAIEVGRGSSVGTLVGFNWRGVITGCRIAASVVGGDNTMNLGALVGFNSWGTVSDCSVTGSVAGGNSVASVGGLVGNNAHGNILNSRVTTTVSAGAGSHDVGGLVGYSEAGAISGSSASGDVSGDTSLGGLVGYKNDGDIIQSYASGAVSGNTRIGGLVGRNDSGTIEDCYATGAVDGADAVGGLVGRNHKGSVSRCYAAGTVTGTSRAGGLVGNEDRGTYLACFWDSDVNPTLTGAGDAEPDPADISAKTTAEMQTAATFLNAGWDFIEETDNGTDDIWKIVEEHVYPLLSWQKYGGGSGEPNDPYLIYTAEHLNAIGADANDWDRHFKLMADVNLSQYTGEDFSIIGHPSWPFTGSFDGSGHSISGFTYTSADQDYIGLFGYVADPNAEIRSISLTDAHVDVEKGDYVAAVVGFAGDGIIADCHVWGGSVSGSSYVGGIVGGEKDGTITGCHTTASVSGFSQVGGLVGEGGGLMTDCSAGGNVTGWQDVGGLIGLGSYDEVSGCRSDCSVSGDYQVGGLSGHWRGGSINHSSVDCNVVGDAQVGGLVGAWWYSEGSTSRCSATGTVRGRINVGGLVGDNDDGKVSYSFAACTVVGEHYVGGLVGRSGTITDCYARGDVVGEACVGGLSGSAGANTITRCYSTGVVHGVNDVGGLVGYRLPVGGGRGTLVALDSFWDTEASAQTTSAGGTGLTTAEMQTASTFLNAGWDFVCEAVNGVEDIWYMPEGDYPRLVWELAEVPPCPAGVLELDATSFGEAIAHGVVLVDFFATWCSPCHAQAPIVDDVAQQVAGRATVAKLDIDQAHNLAQAYGVTAIPTLILFKNGSEFDRFIGVTQAPVLVAAIQDAIDHHEEPPRTPAGE